MPGFEEEAFERARQMHSRRPPPKEERRPEPSKPVPPKPEPPKPEPPPSSVPAPPNLLEALLKDRETGLILLLLLLLMDGDNDPSLLFALMYLLR